MENFKIFWKNLKQATGMVAYCVPPQLAREVIQDMEGTREQGLVCPAYTFQDLLIFDRKLNKTVNNSFLKPRPGYGFYQPCQREVLCWRNPAPLAPLSGKAVHTIAPLANDPELRKPVGGISEVVIPSGNILVSFQEDIAQIKREFLFKKIGGILIYTAKLLPLLCVIHLPGANFEKLAEICIWLENQDLVHYAHPDLAEYHLWRSLPEVGINSELWHLGAINALGAWEKTRGDSRIPVCIYDCGVDYRHPAFYNRYTGGYDVRDDDQEPLPYRFLTHGTKCAGIALAAYDSVNNFAGISPGCSLVVIRKSDIASYSKIIRGFDEADRLGAVIINCSWGKSGHWYLPPAINETLAALFRKGRRGKGILVVWAAGNEAEPVEYDQWASHPDVLAVTAIDKNFRHPAYCDYGQAIDVAAPSGFSLDQEGQGCALRTTTNQTQQGFGWLSGTSAAAAVVSGIAGLVASIQPDLSAAEIKDVLISSCVPVALTGETGSASEGNLFGAGMVNAKQAVETAENY